VIILGCTTLVIFFVRFFIFRFHESPNILLSVGREAEAIEFLRQIAKFNQASEPTLTLEHFAVIDEAASQISTDALQGELTRAQATKGALKSAARGFSHLKAMFTKKLHTFIFVLPGISCMVCQSHSYFVARLTHLG
jgi:hypothetical protein